jgi:hypothetical protein
MQWSGVERQMSGDGGKVAPLSEQLQIVRDPMRQGRFAAKFIVRPGDRYGNSSGERSLAQWMGSDEREGDDYYYAWSTLFPRDWSAPPQWGIIHEWYASGYWQAPIKVSVGADELHLTLNTGQVSEAHPGGSYQTHIPILSTLSKGNWNDFIFHIRWSTTSGTIEVWNRVQGSGDFVKTVDIQNIPTLPWKAAEAPPKMYIVHGFYRGPGSTSTAYLFDDSFRRAAGLSEIRKGFDLGASAPGASPASPRQHPSVRRHHSKSHKAGRATTAHRRRPEWHLVHSS